MRPEFDFRMAANWLLIKKKTMTSYFANMTSSSKFFYVFFLLSSLVTGSRFLSTSWLVLELWKFSFIKDWPEVRKSEIPPSEFCPISGDWGKLGIPNFARMSLIKSYWILQNARVTAFTVSELLRENQQGGKISPLPRLGLKSILRCWNVKIFLSLHETLNFLLIFEYDCQILINLNHIFTYLAPLMFIFMIRYK